MQLGTARTRYIRWLLATRDLSPHTVRAYEGDLAAFERQVGRRLDVGAVDRECLITFLETQRAARLAPASLRRRASALRGFCRWMLSEGFVLEDPWGGASLTLGRSRHLPRVLSADDLNRLLGFLRLAARMDASHTIKAKAVHERPHESATLLAVALMVATGVRVHEVVNLRYEDVDLSGRAVRLVGKGRRERQVFLTNDWITGLTGAFLDVRAHLELSHACLLFNQHFDPLTPPAMRSRLAKAAQAAGLSSRITPHMLRHTAATQLIEAGVDIRYIQRLLGHASLSTTEIYTHVSDKALRRVVSDADVLGRIAQAR